jgi:hypothetical protein
MSNNEKINATTTLANALVFNNRFATAKLTADQLGAEEFATWKKLVMGLHRACYAVYVQCENSGMKVESSTVDKSAIYDAMRVVLAALGEVNGHKLYANEETAIALVSYAGRRGNVDAPELQFCISRISNAKKELALAEKINGYNPEAIQALKDNIDTLTAEKAELLATVDMRHKQPTKTSDSAFRLDFEHYLARVITGQMAKTLEELDAEELARKEARKAKAKARKQAKANA